jgi:hypothetical protein
LNTVLVALYKTGAMQIQKVITTINQMEADGIFERYAIGGAVGATFYLEPVATLDVDIFITFKAEVGSVLVSPQPIFNYLKRRGCAMEGEYIIVAGWPVQFLLRAVRWLKRLCGRRRCMM